MEGCGSITTEHTVWCGHPDCVEWLQLSDKKFSKVIYRLGWRRTKKYGWLCPECAEKQRKS